MNNKTKIEENNVLIAKRVPPAQEIVIEAPKEKLFSIYGEYGQ